MNNDRGFRLRVCIGVTACPLNHRQTTIYATHLKALGEYLRTEGKDPRKGIGYAESSLDAMIYRFHRVVKWTWANDELTTGLSPEQADRIITALDTDTIRTVGGDRFSEGSKRKISDVLTIWFEYRGIDWEPEITFTDESASDNADPFTKRELRHIWQTSLEYKSIPRYNNLSPTERDRWKSHIA